MTDTGVTLSQFYSRLAAHDWFYMYSDDGWVYRRGGDEEAILRTLAKTSPEHQKLFDTYRDYSFNGGDNPERPA